jgi:VRR-NUC domain
MMRRSRHEDAIQRAVFEHLRVRSVPGVFAFHPANGGWRSHIEAAILKGLGVRGGVPDVIAIHRGEVCALEIKTENGHATDAQWQAIEDLRAAGAHAEVCYGLDRAIAQLETWGLLRGRTQ